MLNYSNLSPQPLVISEYAPKILLFPGFLSLEDRNHIIRSAIHENMSHSAVMDGDKNNTQEVRTSSGAWLDDLQDDVLFSLALRIERATGIPW